MPTTENPAQAQLQVFIAESLQFGQNQGNWAQTLDRLNRLLALPSLDNPEKPELKAQALVARGLAHRMLGQHQEAGQDFSDVVLDLLPASTSETRYQALIGLADLRRVAENNPAAGHYTLQEVIKQPQPSPSKVKAFDQKGLLFSAQDKANVAVLWYQEAIRQLKEDIPPTPETQLLLANTLTHLGAAEEHLSLMDDEAFTHQNQALDIYEAINDHRGQFNCLVALGRLAAKDDEHEAALEFYQDAQKLASGKRTKAALFLNLTEAYIALGDLPQAQANYQEFKSRLGPDGFTSHDEKVYASTIAFIQAHLPH